MRAWVLRADALVVCAAAGMRIDYVMLSRSLAPRVSRAVVHGKGAARDGFLGSDHCPLLVTLAPRADEAAASGSHEGAPAAASSTSS